MRALPLLLALLPAPAPAAAAEPEGAATAIASPAEIAAAVAAMEKDMKPGQTFAWRPLLRGGAAVAAIEIWNAPGKPAAHPDEGEYGPVLAGAGSLVSGGRMVDPVTTPSGMIEGSRIEGATSRKLRPGDTFLIPAGEPHGFGVEGELVLLGIKVPRPR
jgi:mannose-6-phosphate isomerase-like protein (cupin superfamily)